MKQQQNNKGALLEFYGPDGLEHYILPLANALALAGALLDRVPYVTLYPYDLRNHNWQANRHKQNSRVKQQQTKIPALDYYYNTTS